MTIKQRKRAKLLGKTRTLQEELLAAGYSPEVARTQPKSVVKAKGWIKLLNQKLPDEDLLDTTKRGLTATKVISAKIVGTNANEQTDDFIEVPDHPTQLKAAEQGYKLKGRFQENVTNVQVNNIIPILGGKTKDVPRNNSDNQDSIA